MKKLFLCLSIFCFITHLFADWQSIQSNSANELFVCDSDNLTDIEVSFALDGYAVEEIQQNGETFQQITYPYEGEILDVGKPDLPCFSRIIAIPDNGSAQFQILSESHQILSNMRVFPQQELQSESSIKRTDFVIDSEFYRGNQLFPLQTVELSEPAVMRDYRIVLLTIYPFQFNPQSEELKITTNLNIKITTNGRSNITQKKISRAFEPTYKANILNYSSLQNREQIYQDPSYLFIYQDNNTVKDNLNYLLEWKQQMGFDVNCTSFPFNVSAYEIKGYIQDAYDNWDDPPEFICIAGDAFGNYRIPVSDGVGDHGYTTLAGNDILADVFIGRLSFETITELQTIIYKILHYEKEPFVENTTWFNSACMAGDPAASGISTVNTKRHVADMILEYDEHFHINEIYTGSFINEITNSINGGIGFFNYRGYYGMSGYNVNNIYQLNNGFMMPVVVALTCDTGSFASGTSRSEAFLRVGSPGQPKGAIAAIGTATTSTHTCFNNCVDAGINYGIFVEHTYHMGGALNRGKLNLYLNYPQNPSSGVNNFSAWNNLMGDPGMAVWTDVPQEMIVNYLEEIPLGMNNLHVNVTDINGDPVENAWVTFLSEDDETVMQTAYSDVDGNVFLDIETDSEYSAKLTVTKHNYIPHQGICNISSNDYSISVSEVIIDDDNNGTSIGNGDGTVNPGESIELQVELHNYGINALSDVIATISSMNNFVNITDDIESYGIIPSGGSGFSSDDFDFTVVPNVMEGDEVVLEILIEDGAGHQWTDNIVIPISGAFLLQTGYGFPNNNNAILDPGETSDFVITIENTGSSIIDDVYGIISSENFQVLIDDEEGYFGNISAGAQITNNDDMFEITIAPTCINGSSINLELYLYNSSGFETTLNFPIQVGIGTIYDPLGPDSYGYFCMDDGDVSYSDCPEYEWLEINDVGTLIDIYDYGNTGAVEVVDLPFTFTFYGEDYDQITVCSNGWISPGITENTSFMNWTIPGALGPSPMIAPFWDDLKSMEDNIFYFYDIERQCFIVEWDGVQNEYNNDPETFQVIIYEQDIAPEYTNNQIKFQYKEIHNVDQGQYPSQHGQFATVGIEDQTSTIGLEYTFNNDYSATNKPLQDNMALLFTGGPMNIYPDPYIILDSIDLIDENGNNQADFGEHIEMEITLRNLGIPDATNVNAELISTDPYLNITQSTNNYNIIPGVSFGSGSQNFVLDVSENCPDEYYALIALQVSSDQGSWDIEFSLELNAPVVEFYSLFIDDGNNNILEPGENAQLQVSFINSGGIEINNLTSNFVVNDPLIAISNNTSQINTITVGNIQTLICDIDVSSSAVQYHEFDLEWEMTGENNYLANGNVPVVIEHEAVEILEEFSLNFPPPGWTVDGDNWTIYNNNEAGGEPPEVAFHFHPLFIGEQKLVTMPINTYGLYSLNMDYKQFLFNWNGSGSEYVISVKTTSNGTDWQTVWEDWPDSNFGPTTNNITINNSDIGSENFQIAFHFSGDTSAMRYWRIDDVHISSNSSQSVGFLQGNVTLNGGNGDVTQVFISTGDFFTYPDETGIYNLPIPIGEYEVNYYLLEYIEEIETVLINAGQNTFQDIELDYVAAPINLVGEVDDNDIVLNWEMPANNEIRSENNNMRSEKNHDFPTDNSRSLSGYRIYRNGIHYQNIYNPDMMHFTDYNPTPSIYIYYVTAMYNNMYESIPSNEVTVNLIVGNDEIIDSFENRLEANYPNPFNPETTISFSTRETNEVTEIIIYNIKGQKVKKLLNEKLSAGDHSAVWNGKDESGKSVASGIYFYEMKIGDYRRTRKMLLLR